MTRTDFGSYRGSCHWSDKYAEALNKGVRVTAGSRPEEHWGVPGGEVPVYVIESEPGDMLLFNRKARHSSWGGGDRRRMFTYNFKQRFSADLMASLHEFLKPRKQHGDERLYGEAMLRTSGPERRRHLELRLQAWEGSAT